MTELEWAIVDDHLSRIAAVAENADPSPAGLKDVLSQVDYARKDVEAIAGLDTDA